MRFKMQIKAMLVALSLTAMTTAAIGQAVFGSITGTVTDSTGAVIPNAAVTITDTAKGTSVTLQSNGSGEFTAEHLIPDTYDVKVVSTGFKTFEASGVLVSADTSRKIEAAMETGGAGEIVNVSADSIPQLKTDRADVATVFSSQEVVELPIPDRNFTNLQLLLPGAQQLGWGHAASENPQGSKQIEVDGQAFAGVSYQLDGTDNQDPILGIIVINPNADSLSEAKITTQNFDAEFGKAVSSVITVQTKSGSNSFHGTAFDYRESNANLATDPFNQPRSSITAINPFPGGLKNQFGGSLGGPVFKDKLFFFMDYQGVRQKVGLANTETVPTNFLVQTCLGQTATTTGVAGCDFSQYGKQFAAATAGNQLIYNNSGGAPVAFAGNVIPASMVSPQFINFLKLLAPYAPNTTGSLGGLVNNYSASGQGGLNDDQYDVRVDDTLSQRTHAFGRFSRFTDILSGTPIFGAAGGKGFGLNGYSGTSEGKNTSVAAGVDIAVTPKLVTDIRAGYFRYNITTHKYNEGVNFATQLGIPGLNLGDIITSGSPGFQLEDPGSYGNGSNTSVYGQALGFTHCNCPLIEHEDQFQLANNWTKTIGNHAVKFGVDLRYARNLRVPSDTDRSGIMNFGTGPTGSGGGSDGLSFATFALGDVTTFGRYASTSTNAKEFQKRYFGYVQDTWRPKSNLTLNLGLRYEYYAPETINAPANGSLLNLATGYLQVAGVGTVASDMNIGAPKNAYNPRIGVAYEVKPGTVIRAGYGRSFDIGVFGSIFGHAATQNLPVLSSQQLTPVGGDNPKNPNITFNLASGPPPPVQVSVPANGLLPNPGSAVNSHARPTTERLPTLDAWNAALQQSITPTLSMTIAYVANKGTHTLGDSSGNQTNPNEATDFLPAQYSITGTPLHYDPNPAYSNSISPDGGTGQQNYLQRYYGLKLPACSDPLYVAMKNVQASNGGCGWTDSIQYYGDDEDTHYNALQATLTKTIAHGYSLNASYAWQKAISEATSYATWNRAAVRGRDSALRQQQIIVYGLFQLPFGRNKQFLNHSNSIINQLVSGYEISPVINYSSGLPFTLSYNTCSNANVGSAPCYLNGKSESFNSHVTGYPGHDLQFYQKYTASGTTGTNIAFTSPGNGTFFSPGVDQIGNIGRNSVFGPHFFNTDLSVQKAVSLHEGVVLQLRADGFNAFNHINFGTPNGNIENGGAIGNGPFPNNSPNPRQLQFSGRVQF